MRDALFSSHETTTNLIGTETLALLDHPEQLARRRADPELVESAIEELLRFDSATQATYRAWPRKSTFAGSAWGGGTTCCSCSARTAVTRHSSSIRIVSTRPGGTTATWPSARARTSAWGLRSAVLRARSPLARSFVGSRRSPGHTANSCGAPMSFCVVWRHYQSRFRPGSSEGFFEIARAVAAVFDSASLP